MQSQEKVDFNIVVPKIFSQIFYSEKKLLILTLAAIQGLSYFLVLTLCRSQFKC